jgi:hypothetical protein
VDIDHRGPAACIDCGQDAYIQLATTEEVYVCAHCFADRGRATRAALAADPAKASQSPPTGPAEGAAR